MSSLGRLSFVPRAHSPQQVQALLNTNLMAKGEKLTAREALALQGHALLLKQLK